MNFMTHIRHTYTPFFPSTFLAVGGRIIVMKKKTSKKDFIELIKLQKTMEKKDEEAIKAINKFLIKYKSIENNKKERLKTIKSIEIVFKNRIKELKKLLS